MPKRKRLVWNKYYDYYYNERQSLRVVYTLDEDGAFDDYEDTFKSEDEAKQYILSLCKRE